MAGHKRFRIKAVLAKKLKQNRPVPGWVRLRTGNTVRYAAILCASLLRRTEHGAAGCRRYNLKRRHWRRTKLRI